MYKNVKNELPTNTFECIVKMWNQFNDSWVTGIGIYDIPTKQWEIQDNGVVVNYPIHFWFKTPELDDSTMQALTIPVVVFSEAELKAKLEEQLEETRQWLIGEDFEGHDLGTVLDKMYDQRFNVGN